MTNLKPDHAKTQALIDRLMLNSPVITQEHMDAATQIMPEAAGLIEALSERAEAAEAEATRLEMACFNQGVSISYTQAALTVARRAEAAAWNDAIEAAAGNCDSNEASFIYMANANLPVISPIVARDRAKQCAQLAESIRALRRAAPTEGEA